MGEFQPLHWLVVIAAVVLLFGAKKLPELGRSLGQAIGGFKKSMKDGLEGTPEKSDTETPKLP
jgi:sec-independent protein translocase protein TatA